MTPHSTWLHRGKASVILLFLLCGLLPVGRVTASSPAPLVTGRPSAIVVEHVTSADPVPSHVDHWIRLRSQTDINRVIGLLNALPPFPKQPMYCPRPDGERFILRLHYARTVRIVIVGLSGCQYVTSAGRPTRIAMPGDS